jgi:hypothetical protein
MGQPSDVSRVQPQSRAAEPRELAAAASQASANGNAPGKSSNDNGHVSLVSLAASTEPAAVEADSVEAPAQVASAVIEPAAAGSSSLPESASLKDAFIRQLQLDRLTLRQMRNWVMADEARRAAEVAASATEATYERLALILFGLDLPELLGRAVPPPSTGMSAEERLEVQREKARIRARQRRAAIKAARLAEHAS